MTKRGGQMFGKRGLLICACSTWLSMSAQPHQTKPVHLDNPNPPSSMLMVNLVYSLMDNLYSDKLLYLFLYKNGSDYLLVIRKDMNDKPQYFAYIFNEIGKGINPIQKDEINFKDFVYGQTSMMFRGKNFHHINQFIQFQPNPMIEGIQVKDPSEKSN